MEGELCGAEFCGDEELYGAELCGAEFCGDEELYGAELCGDGLNLGRLKSKSYSNIMIQDPFSLLLSHGSTVYPTASLAASC
jgi:hypothetical protein